MALDMQFYRGWGLRREWGVGVGRGVGGSSSFVLLHHRSRSVLSRLEEPVGLVGLDTTSCNIVVSVFTVKTGGGENF